MLAPYYREFGLDLNAIPAAAARAPFSDAAADVLGDFKPAVVSFHFGLPSAELLGRVRAWGAKVLSSATTVEEARWLEAHGADAIVAQGLEAGGHRGMFLSDDVTEQMGTLALVPQIVAAVNVPVIAAGGIVDANGVAAAMALGAAGVQVGTAYLLCPEAKTSPIHRAALKGSDARHTALTNVFTGRPARGIMNRIMRELGPTQRGGAGVSARVLRDGAAARKRRAPGPRRFLAAVVGRECQRLQRDSGGRSDARAGRRVRLMPSAQRIRRQRDHTEDAETTESGARQRAGAAGPARNEDACRKHKALRSELLCVFGRRLRYVTRFAGCRALQPSDSVTPLLCVIPFPPSPPLPYGFRRRARSIRYASEAPTAIAPPRSAAPA